MCARALAAAGATPASIVHNAYGYGLFTGGLGIHQGAIELGATVVPVSGGMTPRQVTLIRDLQPDILTCTPSYAIRLGEALAEAGVRPPMTAGIFGAEPWTNELRARLNELLGLHGAGHLRPVRDHRPRRGQRVHRGRRRPARERGPLPGRDRRPGRPASPSPTASPGELVFTTVTKEALPLLRYRTGDIASVHRGTCACGRTLARMSKVAGRKDDMLVIRGVNVYPSEVERVLLGHPALAPDYLLVVDERAPQSRLIACCELGTGGPAPESLPARVQSELKDVLGLSVEVRLLPPESVPRTEVGKAVRVRRWAGGEPPLPGLD